MGEKIKQAVIIGINDYQDPGIPKLSGAVNDATAMMKRLRDYGDFEICNEHFLTDKDASCESIRKAISDLLWKIDPCDLALLYFSGHGFQDGYGNGYIAPCDMTKDEPFVCGISMQELRQVISKSQNKQCVLVILDCCYSGISTKDERAVGGPSVSMESHFESLTGEEGGGGKVIFASSGEDQKSREVTWDLGDEKGVCHGIFTYRLLAGLDGEASDDAGKITLDEWHKYVEAQFIDQKQRPKFYAADSNGLDRIEIANVPQQRKNFITNELTAAVTYITNDDIVSLIAAARRVQNVLDKIADNADALKLRVTIENKLVEYRNTADAWLDEDKDNIRLNQDYTEIYLELQQLVPHINFVNIASLEERKKRLLKNLCDVSSGKLDLSQFLFRCTKLSAPVNSPGVALTSPSRN